MRRELTLWLGLLAFAAMPAAAQTPAAATGTIHGHVTNPTGASTTSGNVSLSQDGGRTSKFTFQVDANGDYKGEAAAGTYMVVFRAPDTPPDKMVDSFDNVKITAGQDTLQDIDMSRQAFIDKLSPDQKKQLEEIKAHNSEAMKANEVVKNLNADLKTVNQDIHDADNARAAATQQLGASASKADLDAKEQEIKSTKFGEIVTLMQKDTGVRATEPILWADLGLGDVGLANAGQKAKYDDAETAYKKALDLETASKKPRPEVLAMANAGLGEIYARTGKVSDANTSYEAAAKADPTKAAFYLTNEAKIFFQTNNPDAQVAAANEALKSDPNQAVLYYIIGNGLVQKATVDPKTQKIVAPPGCLEAYQKYLELAPDGPYANEVKDILTGFGQKIGSSYKAGKKS
jgi:hypothetical protein